MSTNHNFTGSLLTDDVDTCVFIGRKGHLRCNDGGLANIAKEFGVDTSLLDHLVQATSVAEFSGGSSSTLARTKNGKLINVVFLITPDVSSRHNCVTRPDVVSKLWGSVHGSFSSNAQTNDEPQQKKARVDTVSTSVVVVPVLPFTTDDKRIHASALSVGAAIARQSKWYSHKSGRGGNVANLAITFVGVDFKPLTNQVTLTRIALAADAISAAAALVDMPPNELNCNEFVRIATTKAASIEDVTVEVIRGDDLKNNGFGGLFGVGQGAEEPPAMVILKYNSSTPSLPKTSVCWVGKGIVYDTGGLSIKSKTGMPGMKADMGGAAAIMEAFFAAALMGADQNICAILCLAENAVGPKATRPDDIHTLYSGKTVEINNTDAEGRLVLADGVAYASKVIKPDVIANMCTLTGAQGVATGKYFAAIMTNDEALEGEVVNAGRRCGDLCHAMPYAPEIFSSEFASKVADMKNSVANRSNGQVSCAGQFIGNNLSPDYLGKWLHIDMAAPASFNERATGYGVALLLETFIF